MKISILTLFPEMFAGPFDFSIIKKAKEKNLVDIKIINIRDFGIGKHKVVDDTPYGGGQGMILRVDVLANAIKSAREGGKEKVILMSPRGKTFNQKKAIEFSKLNHLIILCGHYEGIDERVDDFVDESISIGDFVTTGGEIPAMLTTDAVVRLIKGVLKKGVTVSESFPNLLEYPQYTKPEAFNNLKVPQILLSGNHKKIEEFRAKKSLEITLKIRPDLLRTKESQTSLRMEKKTKRR